MFYVNDPTWKEACLVSLSSLSVLVNCLFLNLNLNLLSAFFEDCHLHWISCVTRLLWVEKFNFLPDKVHTHITCVGASGGEQGRSPEGELGLPGVQQADRVIVNSHWFHTALSICITPDLSPRDYFSSVGNVVPPLEKSRHKKLPSWSASGSFKIPFLLSFL